MATDGHQGDARVAEHGLDRLIAALVTVTAATVRPVPGPGDRTASRDQIGHVILTSCNCCGTGSKRSTNTWERADKMS